MLPKGAMPHLRSPLAPPAPRDPFATGQGAQAGYPQQGYESEHGDQGHMQPGAPRDIFSTLRPESSSLASRLQPLSSSGAGRPHQPQDDYGHQGYGDHAGHQPYPGQQGGYGHPHQQAPHQQGGAHDPYGRPLPGGYPDVGQGRYQDPNYYPEQTADPMHRYQQGHGQASHGQPQGQGYGGQYGRDDAYAYDDPYQADAVSHQYPGSHDPHAAQGAEGEYYEEDYAEEPEPRRGPRAAVVVGALIGAIALGGGLAYGYKAMTSGGRDSGKLPILRADSAPSKAKPTEPGGKQVAHTDKKFLNRLTDEPSSARSGPGPVPVSILPPNPDRDAASGDSGTRRVPTMVVNRDGSISPTSSAPSAPPPTSGVPGMVIEGLTPRSPPPAAAPPPLRESVAPAPPPRAMAFDAAPPRRVASAPPTVASEPPPAAAPPAPRADTEARPRQLPTVRQAARTPVATPAAPAPTGAGYVAVVSSRQSHMEALKAFADIQQKYGSVLQGRTPDVREANLGEKGVWFRVVLGPPGSRESANSVCSQLKTQGYSGCWIMPY
jgi:hypothetical protein